MLTQVEALASMIEDVKEEAPGVMEAYLATHTGNCIHTSLTFAIMHKDEYAREMIASAMIDDLGQYLVEQGIC